MVNHSARVGDKLGKIILMCFFVFFSIFYKIMECYHIVAEIPNIQHEISRYVDGLHACKCDKSVIPWFCACTCDNALAHARALSHRTCARTMV